MMELNIIVSMDRSNFDVHHIVHIQTHKVP